MIEALEEEILEEEIAEGEDRAAALAIGVPVVEVVAAATVWAIGALRVAEDRAAQAHLAAQEVSVAAAHEAAAPAAHQALVVVEVGGVGAAAAVGVGDRCPSQEDQIP